MDYQGSGHSDFLWISGSGAAGLGCEAALASARVGGLSLNLSISKGADYRLYIAN